MANLTDYERLKSMRMGVRNITPVSISGATFNLRPLTSGEMAEISTEVAFEFGKLPESKRNRLTENQILSRKILSRASSEYQSTKLPEISEEMLKHFTPDEVSYLHDEYCAIVDRVSPIIEQMSDVEFKEIIEALKKKTITVRSLSFKNVAEICERLIFSKGD